MRSRRRNVYITPELDDLIRSWAARHGLSVSAVMEIAAWRFMRDPMSSGLRKNREDHEE